ncbi:uncharacterized protein (DUF58 family) [Haloferula luteola]|uniref:Uncharacterized protein (DUF58 family) n=1 Tax=Haloferula luteola TaxID=595692 RepID=A0A840V9J0_9BACT|nr:uncharacterized protein (DUF58 family) [Haloferula luteola]
MWVLLGLLVSIERSWLWAWAAVGGTMVGLAAFDALLGISVKGISVMREVPGRFAVGEVGVVRLKVVHAAARRRRIEIFDGIPEGSDAPRMPWRGEVAGKSTTGIEHPVKILERGLAMFRPMHVRARSPLGLWWRAWRVGEEVAVKVYPDYEPTLRLALLSMASRQDQMGIVRKALVGSSRDFHQLREYREGDPWAQIDWKASSRRAQLISREFQEQRNQTLIFLADTGRRMRARDGELQQFDHCLNAMLLVASIALRQGDRVGVQSFGGSDLWMPPVKGFHSMPKVLDHLYDYRTTPAPSDFTAAAEKLQARQQRRAMVVLLTNLRGEDATELVPALASLTRRHVVVLASLRERTLEDARERPVEQFADALKFAAAEHYDRERAQTLASLRSHGVITLDVPADELPVALANRYLDIKAAGRL